MIGAWKDRVATPACVAGGPRPGARRLARFRSWRPLLVVAVGVAILAPLGFFASGCSSKPVAKKRGKTTKRPETGLAELAGDEGSRTPATARPDAGDGGADPGADRGATPVAADAAATRVADEPEPPPPEPASPGEPTPPVASTPASSDEATPATSLDGLAAAAGDAGPARPTSKLIDADTALVLDGGRVEICSPLGWARSPRSQNYLVRYQPGPRKSYPSIVVTVESAPEGLGEISAANQADLVSAIGTKLAETFPADGQAKLIKKPAAANFGSHKGVAWAMPGTAKVGGLSEPIERFAYGVVLGGRLYIVEARAPKGKVDDDAKAAAKAVAATLFRPEGAPLGQPEGAAIPAGGESAATAE